MVCKQKEYDKQKERILSCVQSYAENLLHYGRVFEDFPLLADGVYMEDKKPVRWIFPEGVECELSDMANHQTMYRNFALLSELTGEEKYKKAAKEEIAYYFSHYRDESGLLMMGGHMFVDLKTRKPVGKVDKMGLHELKNCFPFYELMFEVDAEATEQYIEAVWNAHVLDWNTLEISRHGEYDKEKPQPFWERQYEEYQKPEPFFEALGLSFIDAGNDLLLSAGMLAAFTGKEKPLEWAKRLLGQYVSARDERTGLGGYQFTQPKKRMEPTDDRDTKSWFGDRARRQFGPEFGDWVLEGRVIFPHHVECMYYKNALMQLYLAELLGSKGEAFKKATLDGMRAFLTYEYDFSDNGIRPMLSDGTDLSGYALKRDGYFGAKGFAYQKEEADERFLISAFRAYQASKEEIFWEFARNVAKFRGLGDLGTQPGENVKLDSNTTCADARALIALVDLYRATKNSDYCDEAAIVAENLLKERYRDGWFLHPEATHLCRFDEAEPFALLLYCAALEDLPEERIPKFLDGEAYVQGAYRNADGSVENRNYAKSFYLL